MRNFSATELANKTGEVLAAAAREPVRIQRYGKPRFVILSVDQFELLMAKADRRRSIHVEHLAACEVNDLIAQLQLSINNG